MGTYNDNFADIPNVVILPGGNYSSSVLDLSGNTVETGEHDYAARPGEATGRTAWWKYTPAGNGLVTVSVNVIDSPHRMVYFAIYTSTLPNPDIVNLNLYNPGGFYPVSTFGSGGTGTRSFNVAAGTAYYFQFTGSYEFTAGDGITYLDYDLESAQAALRFQVTVDGPSTIGTGPVIIQQPLLYVEVLGEYEVVDWVPAGATWVELRAAAYSPLNYSIGAQWQVEVNGVWQDIPGADYSDDDVSVSPITTESIYAIETVHQSDNGKRFRVAFFSADIPTYSDPLTLAVGAPPPPLGPRLQLKMADGTYQTVGVWDRPLNLKLPDGGWITFNDGGGKPLQLKTNTGVWYTVSTSPQPE